MAPQRSRLDANLVLALHALLEARGVSRAAERLGMGQPAMSHALKRLRAHFGDDLLVRGDGRHMQLTPRARELADLARQGVEAVERVFDAPPPFDPSSARRDFRVAASDGMDVILLSRLLPLLSEQAPGIDLQLPGVGAEVMVALDEGRVDLVLGHVREPPIDLRRRRMYWDRMLCVVRRDHPEVGDPLGLETYLALRHLLVAPQGSRRGEVDAVLDRLGRSRRVAVVLPSLLAALTLIAECDLVLTLPGRLARAFASRLPIRVLEPPIELTPYEVVQLWHERDHQDPAHQWLRGALSQALEPVD
ncbi:MAG: LysR family transcriptional regulator [Myxococcota bacterium]